MMLIVCLYSYAYVEFTEPSLVAQALVLNESIFRGRSLKVSSVVSASFPCALYLMNMNQVVPKRTNLPGMARGRGGRGRGGPGRGGFPPAYRGGYAPRGGGYRGGYRGRGRGYAPY
jgi:polyadenylate-binding protein 2